MLLFALNCVASAPSVVFTQHDWLLTSLESRGITQKQYVSFYGPAVQDRRRKMEINKRTNLVTKS